MALDHRVVDVTDHCEAGCRRGDHDRCGDLDWRVACRGRDQFQWHSVPAHGWVYLPGQRQAEGEISFVVSDCLPALRADGRCHRGSGHLVRGETSGHGIKILPAGISIPGWRQRPVAQDTSLDEQLLRGPKRAIGHDRDPGEVHSTRTVSGSKILPGLRIAWGSSACLSRRIVAIS